MNEAVLVGVGFGGAVLGFVLKEVWRAFFAREVVTQGQCGERRERCAGSIREDLSRGDGCFGDIEAELAHLREVMAATGMAVLELCKQGGTDCDELRNRIANLARGH